MANQCLITGCDLYVPQGDFWIHGDLHYSDACDAYVFNGSGCVRIAGMPDMTGKVLTIMNDEYISVAQETVFVLPTCMGMLNDAAIEYIRRHRDWHNPVVL